MEPAAHEWGVEVVGGVGGPEGREGGGVLPPDLRRKEEGGGDPVVGA